MRRDVV